ncbi:hypothetical protein [Sphingomonas sp. ATCC 31555]|nr:hypothetical protein [Sphingomonas sp. ATCC 31555]
MRTWEELSALPASSVSAMSKKFDIWQAMSNFFYIEGRNRMAVSARQRKIGVAAAVMMLGSVVAGLVIAILPLHLPIAIAGGLAALVLAAAFLVALPWWRMLDYMQRDGHLFSWYWGGSFGGGLALVLLAIGTGVRSPWFAGAALVWLLQCGGYGISRLIWWFAHRSQAS